MQKGTIADGLAEKLTMAVDRIHILFKIRKISSHSFSGELITGQTEPIIIAIRTFPVTIHTVGFCKCVGSQPLSSVKQFLATRVAI
jgi:hypothetical protein